MASSTSKGDGIFAKELEDELMKFTANYEEKKVGTHFVDQTKKIQKNTAIKSRSEEAEYSDTTECSSSFDDSDYGAEGVDDSEALSHFCDDAESNPDFDGPRKLFRSRRKVSSHWRSFIHPIMWRCKWAELQIKKLEGQAKKYGRKLEEYRLKPMLEGSGNKLPTFLQNHVRSDVLRRKKRRRAEATNDVATYMSHHNLFSYHENKKTISKAACHVFKNPDAAQEETSVDDEYWDNDEQIRSEDGIDNYYLENVLQKIEHLHSRVNEMKVRVEKVTRERAGKFHDICSTSSPPSTGYRLTIGNYIASQLMSEYNLGGLLLPESAHGEATPDANRSCNRAHFAYPYGNEDDDILIDNQRVTEEMHYFEEMKIHSVPDKPDLAAADDRPPPEICSASNVANAAARGRRKGAAR